MTTFTFAEQLAALPKLANLGPLFKSSNTPIELTESETEYVVRCVKHTFPHHIVFQVCLKFDFEILEVYVNSKKFNKDCIVVVNLWSCTKFHSFELGHVSRVCYVEASTC